jgi:hypothetical protein
MKRTAAFLLLLLAGCTTAPVADFLDFVHPSRVFPQAPGSLPAPIVVPGPPRPPGPPSPFPPQPTWSTGPVVPVVPPAPDAPPG